MNRLVLIGNGFDLAHGLKTKYEDFIDWYWAQRAISFNTNRTRISEDPLCKLEIKYDNYAPWNAVAHNCGYFHGNTTKEDIFRLLENNKDVIKISYSPFFRRISDSIETKGWVDIEEEYYKLLVQYALNSLPNNVVELNNQLAFLQERLVEYLKSVQKESSIGSNGFIMGEIYNFIKPSDISVLDKKNFNNLVNTTEKEYPKQTLLLNFNYTNTANLYADSDRNAKTIFIHGKLETPKSVIFGYGDEHDDGFQSLKKLQDKEWLRNIKTVRYLDTNMYKQVLSFIEAEPFQVFIMGHSCGKSDYTLLNTVFEHRNCVSIKPFYYVKPDGTNNYNDIVHNIYRNFNDMNLMRSRVVDEEHCRSLG